MENNNMKKYETFLSEVRKFIPEDRIYTDELRRLAWGTDAGFYRMIPQIIIRSNGEKEISQLLSTASFLEVPVTFRAAGTSLSGQSISDSVLIVAGKNWEEYSVAKDGEEITLQPGIVGQRVNDILAPYKRKMGPDPASIKSAMIGGIVMNNASGMNCGTHANSDKMMLSARIVLADGTVLDTGNKESRIAFHKSHPETVKAIEELRDEVRANKPLAERIAHKYAIKNVTGLNLRPLIAYDDPIEIMAHMMVGSEGTLAFLSSVTMKTLKDYPYKATAMLYFKSIREACQAVVKLKPMPVQSAELLDWKSLSSVDDANYLRMKEESGAKAAEGLTAVLTETMAFTRENLDKQLKDVCAALEEFDTYVPVEFTEDPAIYSKFWAIRSGIFPSVGGTREPGTTCLIEDIAFQIKDLPDATCELQELIARHGYDDACIYGHAFEGNYHFIVNQRFDNEAEVARYEALMEDVKKLVVDKYDGSLKAEHGTGRNMAPFVCHEWGEEAYAVMRKIKDIFDPKRLLNPGVIINDDPRCYLKNFKPLPLMFNDMMARVLRGEKLDEEEEALIKVNRCIECGFCEVNCVSCGFTLSSRQRIVIQRELTRLKELINKGDTNGAAERYNLLKKQFQYPGNETCAGDGLCSTSCPMGINVADLTHWIRQQELPEGSTGYKIGKFAADHLHGVKNGLRPILSLANFGHTVLGTSLMSGVCATLHKTGIPLWTPAMPKALYTSAINQKPKTESQKPKVVYFPSCINQAMGQQKNSPYKQPLVTEMTQLLEKAGYEVIYPENMDNLCCGTIWESKGMPDIADRKTKELEDALIKASENGRYPVLCDQSPCLHRMRKKIKSMQLYEPAEFIYTFLRERLTFKPKNQPVAIHITCSTREMGLAQTIIDLAQLCTTEKVLVPEGIGCCAFAGDRGFTHPELNKYALRKLPSQVQKAGIAVGYSNSRTCEIGLSSNSGVPYVSIAYLVNECTE